MIISTGGFADSNIRIYDSTSAGASVDDDADRSDKDDPSARRSGASAVLRGHRKPVYCLSWFPEDSMLLSGSGDGTVRLWSELMAANVAVFRTSGVPVLDVAACPRGYYFASASLDGTAVLWCTERLEPLRVFAGGG